MKVPVDTTSLFFRRRRELATRVSGRLEVTLYWSAHDNSTSVEVWDSVTEEMRLFTVPGERALEAFYHPYAHLHYEEQDVAGKKEGCKRGWVGG